MVELVVSNEGMPREVFDEAADELRQRTCELVANILRIAAGAGKHYELFPQLEAFVDAVNENNQHGHDFSPHVIEKALRSWRETTGYHREPRDDIIQGALRIVAGEFLHQNTLMINAEHFMFDAIRRREQALREENKNRPPFDPVTFAARLESARSRPPDPRVRRKRE